MPSAVKFSLQLSPTCSTRCVSTAMAGLRGSTGRSITVVERWLPDSALTLMRPLPMRRFALSVKKALFSPGASKPSEAVAGPTVSKLFGSASSVSFTLFTAGSNAKALTGRRISSSGPSTRGAVASTDSGSRTITLFSARP